MAAVVGTLAAGALGVAASADDGTADDASARTTDTFAEKFGADRRAAAKVELGRRLFFDPAVSRLGKTSCASCHDPEHGFSDPATLSLDETGATPRHSQAMLDLAEAPPGFHWDGEFRDLREIVTARLGSGDAIARDSAQRLKVHLGAAIEAGAEIDEQHLGRELSRVMTASVGYGSSRPAITPTTTPVFTGGGGGGGSAGFTVRPQSTPAAGNVARRLETDDLYDAGFRRAFGESEISVDRIAEALEAYMLSLRSTESPFDRYMAGDERAMGPAATRGFELFAGKAGCASCHTVPVPGRGRAFSDFAYHNTGVAYVGLDARKARLHTIRSEMKELAGVDLDAALLDLAADSGRARVTAQKGNQGRFKTANLRDVAKRGPYMHDGGFETLEEVVRYYDQGGTPNAHLDPAMKKLGLTDREVADVVAFLESLSGDDRPALGELPKNRPERVRLRVLDVDGKPLKKRDVTVRAAGDRLRGTTAMPAPFVVTTDRFGYATFPFPASTHVALDVAGHELGDSRLLPDWTDAVSVIATPTDTVSVIVRGDGTAKLGSQLTVAPVAGAAPTPPPGRAVTFQRERVLDGGRVLYTARLDELEHFDTCRSAALSVSSGKRRSLGTFSFDASGGMTEMVDLRPLDRDPVTARERVEATSELLTLLQESEMNVNKLLLGSRSRRAPATR